MGWYIRRQLAFTAGFRRRPNMFFSKGSAPFFFFVFGVAVMDSDAWDLNPVVRVFKNCWIEIAVLQESTCHVVPEMKNFETPLLLTSTGRDIFPLPSTAGGNQMLMVKTKCFFMLLLDPCDKWNRTTMELAWQVLLRYGHPNQVYAMENNFVAGIINGRASFLLFIKNELSWLLYNYVIIHLTQRTGTWKTEFGIFERMLTFSSTLTESTTVVEIHSALVSLVKGRHQNGTKLWNVMVRQYLIGYTPCVKQTVNPYILLTPSKDERHFIFLVINFLSHGIYKDSFIWNLVPNGRRLANEWLEKIYDECNSNWYSKISDETAVNQIFLPSYAKDTETTLLGRNILLSSFGDEYNFVTCGGRELQSSSFTIYVKSFKTETWIGFILTFSLVISVGIWFVRKHKFKDSPFFTIYAILLEVSTNATDEFKKKLQYSLVVVPILFMGIVLTNGYRGVITTELTAPLSWKGLATFIDVINSNFSIVSELDMNGHDAIILLCPEFNGLPFQISNLNVHTRLIQKLRAPENQTAARKSLVEKLTEHIKVLAYEGFCTNDHYKHMYSTRQSKDVFEILRKCDRSVMAIQTADVYPVLARENLKLREGGTSSQFYHGRPDTRFNFGFRYMSLHFSGMDHMRIRRNVVALSSGGFFLYWEGLSRWSDTRKYDSGEAKFNYQTALPFPLTLGGKCSTIFILYGIGVIGCNLILSAEAIRNGNILVLIGIIRQPFIVIRKKISYRALAHRISQLN